MDIFITVDKQKMRCNNNVRSFVAGTQEFVLFNFLLSDEWDNLTTYAQFTQNGKSYNVYLDSDDSAYLPPEIKEGICNLALRGTRENTIAVTEPIKLNLSSNPIQGDLASTGITLTLYEQLVNKIDNFFDDNDDLNVVVENVLKRYIEEGKLVGMTIEKNSIDLDKLKDDSFSTNDEIKEYLKMDGE